MSKDQVTAILYGDVTCSQCGSQITVLESEFGEITTDPCNYCLKEAVVKALELALLIKPAEPI